MTPVALTGGPVAVEDIVSVALEHRPVTIGSIVIEKLEAARSVLDAAARRGQRIYGLNTGLGANLDAPVADDPALFQVQFLEGRSAAIGDALPTAVVRATMFTRAAMLAAGGSGISPDILQALVAALNAGVHPRMPRFGSIGAGDLVLMAAIGRMLIGRGDAEYRGEILTAAAALDAAGLTPVSLRPKDGLSLANASALSVGHGALAVAQGLAALDRQTEAAALTIEGIGANVVALDPRIHAARPALGQQEAAARLSALLDRPDRPQPTTLQDPLSIRCLPSIHGSLIGALAAGRRAVELEAGSAGDNPLVLAADGLVLSTGNFHTPALALAFEALGLAIAQAAAASVARFIQLTGAGKNGLPKYLSPRGGASAGFVPLQKTAVSILGSIRHKANPVMLDYLPVSEGVEDVATQTPLTISKCEEMIDLWRRVIALEMLAAAQAVDLRGPQSLGPVTAAIHARIRNLTTAMTDDRALGDDVEALYAAMN